MKVYGASVVKGLLYTLKTFVSTYVEDFKRMSGAQEAEHGLRTAYDQTGVVTIQYPENPMPVGETYERFRVLPMLIYDEKEDGDKDVRCTSCGICAKVCPPQCIWIVQETDENNKPVPNPEDFWIDMSVCMNCGMCTEFCPFDAIKMDHKIDLTVTEDRRESYLYDKERLLVSADYYASIHPKANAAEVEARLAEAEAKRKKEEAKKARLAAKKKKAAEEDSGDDKPKVVKKAKVEKAVKADKAEKPAKSEKTEEGAQAETKAEPAEKTAETPKAEKAETAEAKAPETEVTKAAPEAPEKPQKASEAPADTSEPQTETTDTSKTETVKTELSEGPNEPKATPEADASEEKEESKS